MAGICCRIRCFGKNRVKETRAGLVDRGDSADGGGFADGGASKLTIGAGTLVGNPAKLLSRRKKEAPAEADEVADGDESKEGVDEKDDILAQLRRWKIEMAESFSRFQLERDADLEFEVPEKFEAMPPPPPRPPQPQAPASGGYAPAPPPPGCRIRRRWCRIRPHRGEVDLDPGEGASGGWNPGLVARWKLAAAA